MAGAAKAAGKPSRAPDLVGEGKSTTGEPLGGGEPATPKEPTASKPADGDGGGEPRESSRGDSRGPLLPASAGSRVNQGAGFILGALFWAWVGLPFLKGGPAQVRNTLKAKFFNKAPDGGWLP